MRFKPVPEAPDSLEDVAAVQRALPLVPDSENDCCARIVTRTDVPARDEAKTWITFLRALGLAKRYDRGYARTRAAVDPDALASAFEDRVFAAREVLAVLEAADRPLTPSAVFDRVADEVPRWERDRGPEWTDRWRDRVRRLLDWAVLLGFAVETDDGYRRA